MKILDKVFMTGLVFVSLMLLSTTSKVLSNTFEAHAANNCDFTSTCENFQTGSGNSQNNNCTDFSGCVNLAECDRNTQSNRCDSEIVVSSW